VLFWQPIDEKRSIKIQRATHLKTFKKKVVQDKTRVRLEGGVGRISKSSLDSIKTRRTRAGGNELRWLCLL